jgi:radical SAM superfamily enzyme YgiQ (UPF0313 family)
MRNKKREKIKLYTWRNVDRHPPYNLLYLASSLLSSNFDVSIGYFDSGQLIKKELQEIIEEKPVLVGISLASLQEIVRSSFKFAKFIKERSSAKIVFGGPHASGYAKEVLKNNYIDYVCLGNGEELIADLSKAILEKDSKQIISMSNLAYKMNGKTYLNHISQITNLDQYKIPWNLINLEDYVQEKDKNRIFSIITSRGCPHNCGFCFNNYFHKRKWVSHSAEYVVDLINFLKKKTNMTRVKIIDDNFFVDIKRAYNVLKVKDVKFSFSVRANEINEQIIKDKISKKCYELLIGFESGSERILKDIIKKGVTVEENKKIIFLLSKFPNIKIIGSLVLGLPTENEFDINDTKKFVRYSIKTNKEMQFMIFRYSPMVNTPLTKNAVLSLEQSRGFINYSEFYINHTNIQFLDEVFKKVLNYA